MYRLIRAALGAFLLWIPAASSQPAPEVGQFRVYRRAELPVTKETQPAYQAFNGFSSAYLLEMGRKSTSSRPAGWDFWIVLRPDPKHQNRPHILVVGHSGRLTVRIADLNPAAEWDSKAEAARVARRSVKTMLDPYFNQVARSGARVESALVPRR